MFLLCFLKNNKWHKYDQIRCKYGEYIEIKEDINIPKNSIAVAVREKFN